MGIDMKELYEAVASQIRKELGWAEAQYEKTKSDYDRGMMMGYKMVVEHILDYEEKQYGYVRDEA